MGTCAFVSVVYVYLVYLHVRIVLKARGGCLVTLSTSLLLSFIPLRPALSLNLELELMSRKPQWSSHLHPYSAGVVGLTAATLQSETSGFPDLNSGPHV